MSRYHPNTSATDEDRAIAYDLWIEFVRGFMDTHGATYAIDTMRELGVRRGVPELLLEEFLAHIRFTVSVEEVRACR